MCGECVVGAWWVGLAYQEILFRRRLQKIRLGLLGPAPGEISLDLEAARSGQESSTVSVIS